VSRAAKDAFAGREFETPDLNQNRVTVGISDECSDVSG